MYPLAKGDVSDTIGVASCRILKGVAFLATNSTYDDKGNIANVSCSIQRNRTIIRLQKITQLCFKGALIPHTYSRESYYPRPSIS